MPQKLPSSFSKNNISVASLDIDLFFTASFPIDGFHYQLTLHRIGFAFTLESNWFSAFMSRL